jgi:hypothetical protein
MPRSPEFRTTIVQQDLSSGIYAAREAILDHLREVWPDSVDLSAQSLSERTATADFLSACVALRDEGLIMYEAMLVGTEPSPKLIAAALTRKGQQDGGASAS